jgi:hypothetical protein
MKHLTFGVEFEFCVACVVDPQKPPPGPSEKGKVFFEHTEDLRNEFFQKYGGEKPELEIDEDSNEGDEEDERKNDEREVAPRRIITENDLKRGSADTIFNMFMAEFGIYRHITKTLNDNGYLAWNECGGGHSPFGPHWTVTNDLSVKGPEATPYTWFQIEVISPKLDYTPESIETVKEVADLLAATYKTYNDHTSGLHIHIGREHDGFPFPVIRDLNQFLWAFEPQLDTLHPLCRRNAQFGQAMRDASNLAIRHFKAFGQWPTVSEGLASISKAKVSLAVLNLTRHHRHPKIGVYNQDGLIQLAEGSRGYYKPTIEFRQHIGTLDSKAVAVWLKTVAGIVNFIRGVDPLSFHELISITEQEEWQKLGDGLNDERQSAMGPILAENGFTAIDLLEKIGLQESANYYRNRLIRHPRIISDSTPPVYLFKGE